MGYIIIPDDVLNDKNLTPNEKILFGEILKLSQETGECWASNKYFCEIMNTTHNESVSRWIKHLKEKNYIEIEMITNENGKILKRVMKVINQDVNTPLTEMLRGYEHKCYDPLNKNVKENNTSNNNTSKNKRNSNTINSITKKKSKFSPPTLDEINEYIKEKSLAVDGKQFFEYFTEGNWIDSKGNKVRNWKQKLLTWNRYRVTSVPQRKKKLSEMTEEEYKAYAEEEERKFLEATGGT